MTDKRVSNPSNPRISMKAVSAARAAPVRTGAGGPVSARLKGGAENAALNVVGMFRDTLTDFQRSDRFFKYKAFVIAGWLALSGTSIVIACPGSGGPHNTLSAKLVQAMDVGRPVLMISNTGTKDWTNVVVVVNGSYRAAVGKVTADNSVTLEPKNLLGEGGAAAPESLKVKDVVVQAKEGDAELLSNGQPP
jgi:hypothetical protein